MSEHESDRVMTDFKPEDNVGTIPVQEKHQFDTSRLAEFLGDSIPDFAGDLSVEEFAGGQSNPTYLLTSGQQKYVLRRFS